MIAIVGATGRAGGATVRTLLARGVPVRAVVRDANKAAELAAAGCELAVAELADWAALAAAFRGADAAQVIVPVVPRGDSYALMTATIDTVAAALAEARTPRVLAISDYGAQLTEDTGVTSIFHHLETRLAALDAAVTFLRSAEHMQNWARQLRFAAERGSLPTMHHPLTKRFPTVSAADVGVIAGELLASSDGDGDGNGGAHRARPRVVHVEGPRRYSALDVAAALGKILGREVVARELPRAEWRAMLIAGGIGERYANLVVSLFDVHNAGRIDVEPGVGELRRGTTELVDALAALPRPATAPHPPAPPHAA